MSNGSRADHSSLYIYFTTKDAQSIITRHKPTIDSYDATVDPQDHLFTFLVSMRLQNAPDPIKYRTFPMFLKGKAPRRWTIQFNFAVVKAPSAYNLILGRPTLNVLRAATPTYHLSMKFPTPDGVDEVWGDVEAARECYLITLKGKSKRVAQISAMEPKEYGVPKRLGTTDEIEEFPLSEDDPDRKVKIGSQLPEEEKNGLKALLSEYRDIFSWSADEMPGSPPLRAYCS